MKPRLAKLTTLVEPVTSTIVLQEIANTLKSGIFYSEAIYKTPQILFTSGKGVGVVLKGFPIEAKKAETPPPHILQESCRLLVKKEHHRDEEDDDRPLKRQKMFQSNNDGCIDLTNSPPK